MFFGVETLCCALHQCSGRIIAFKKVKFSCLRSLDTIFIFKIIFKQGMIVLTKQSMQTTVVSLLFLLGLSGQVTAESPVRQSKALRASSAGSGLETQGTTRTATDTDIRQCLRDIDAKNIETTVRTLVGFGTRNMLSTQTDPKRGIGAARDWIAGEFRKIAAQTEGRMTVELQTYEQPVAARVPKPTMLTNVVATLHGAQPESEQRYIVVSGHYDSICTDPINAIDDAPGANDDASGVAAVLEMARVMSRYRFNATLVFMAVAGEEQGLLGSTYHAEQAKKSTRHLEAMFTNDIIGGTLGGNGVHDDRSVRVFSEGIPSNETEADAKLRRSIGGENDAPSRQLARYIKENAEKFVPGFKVNLIYRRDRYLRGGDHIPFLEQGYPAVRFTEPNENYQHQHQNVRVENGIQYGDLPQFVDFAYVAQVARVNCVALSTLALAPDAPQKVALLTRQLTSDTTLQWAANVEPNLAGYEIVWRDTTAPLWVHRKLVGNVTTYTFKGVSKDNILFGVCAVDKEGHRSPVTFPRPVR